MGLYVSKTDLDNALSAATVIQLSDDDRDGAADANVLAACIEAGEAETDSFLFGFYDLPLTNQPKIDRLVKLAALDFTIFYLFRRHPEYVRTFGSDDKSNPLYKSAVSRMMRIQQGAQHLPDAAKTAPPGNESGFVEAGGTRMIGPDGELFG